MALKINDIPPEGLTIELRESIDLFDQGSAATNFTASLTIIPVEGGTLRVSGTVQAEPAVECGRCLKLFSHRIESAVNIDLAPDEPLAAETEHELVRAEMNTEFYHGDEIEPRDLIKEQLLLALPAVPVHSPDCKGLCPLCGTDLNAADCGCQRDIKTDVSAFAALKDFFKKNS